MIKKIISACIVLMMTTSAMAQDWRNVFTDTLLQNLINEALKANSDIRTAQLSAEQSRTLLKSAKLSYLPNFSFAPSGSVSKTQGNPAVTTYELPLMMNWELNLGGKTHHQKEMAKSQILQSEEQLKYAQLVVIADLANAYYTLVMLDRQRDIVQNSIKNQEENLRVLRALKSVGKQTETAVNQAEASYQGVVASLPSLELQIKKTETAISLLVNRLSDNIQRTSWSEIQNIALDPEKAIPLEALSSRPDVLAAEYALRSSFSNVKVARSEFYPSLSISGKAGWTGSLGEMVNPAQWLLNAIGTLTQPLFSAGKLKTNLKVAQLQQEQAKIAFEKALLVAGGEVRNALAESQASRQKSEARQQQVESSRKAYENSQQQMRYSSTTYLEVLTAQSSWLDAQLQQVAEWLELQQSLINLYKATCGEKEYFTENQNN